MGYAYPPYPSEPMANSQDGRPDPDALLADIDREQRGGLKVFLGAAPGVGKTYAMLLAAQEARREGREVVIGTVESHGRAETEELCEGLERIPLQSVAYRGRSFEEFDLDAALARRPDVVLVDELAHRNIPGTRHPRRYQDIEELIGAGIEVWTTLNVQHLESLNDRVARISGVQMRETVPDELLEKARDVVLIDLTPKELIERLQQGKVYVPEQVRGALEGFFNDSNLTALREMAFVAAADRVDADLREVMQRRRRGGPWPARDRVVIAVDAVGMPTRRSAPASASRPAAARRGAWCSSIPAGRVHRRHRRRSIGRSSLPSGWAGRPRFCAAPTSKTRFWPTPAIRMPRPSSSRRHAAGHSPDGFGRR